LYHLYHYRRQSLAAAARARPRFDSSDTLIREDLPKGQAMLNLRTKIGALVLGSLITFNFSSIAAWADDADAVLARVKSLEKELAAVKKENETLRQIKQLREENTKLAKLQPAENVRHAEPVRNPQDAYAADMPGYYKAAPAPQERGLLKLWVEGGAIWSGGDPIDSFYTQTVGLANVPGFFALTPKPGWEAATGFDYRFAVSPWHVSGQLRYGEARASASALITQNFIQPGGTTIITSDSPRADQRETHWLADMALGRDVIGSGPDAMQFKFGVRVAELRSVINATNPRFASFVGITVSDVENAPQDNRFLGAGPRIGLDGSVPMGSGWTFDYLGDVAALFGTQKFQRVTSIDNFVTNLPGGVPAGPTRVVDAVEKFGTVFNSDIQLGISYWVSQNMKISASYRLDAFFNVFAALDAQNDATRLQRIDRYIHGPRLAVTAQF
jgi:hypothetical protein